MHMDTINFYTDTVTDLDLAWGSQGQRKAKPLGFIFSHTLQHETCYGVEAIQAEDPSTIIELDFMK